MTPLYIRRHAQFWRIMLTVAALAAMLCIGYYFTSHAPSNFPKTQNTSSLPSVAAAPPLPAELRGYTIAAANTLSGQVTFLGGVSYQFHGAPHGMAIQPGTDRLWVTNSNGSDIWIFDMDQQTYLADVSVGVSPTHVVFSPDGKTAYAADFSESAVSVIDLASLKTIATIQVPGGPHQLVLSQNGAYLYAACPAGGSIDIISTSARAVIGKIPIESGTEPYGIVMDPGKRYLYATDTTYGRVLKIDTQTNTVVATAYVGPRPLLENVIPNSEDVAAAVSGSGEVVVMNREDMRIVRKIRIGAYVDAVAATPDGKWLIAADAENNTLSVIQVANWEIKDVIALPAASYPNDVIVFG